ncbi:MAG: nucleobase:cation symporter-2 family protein [Candidatus Thermoplasmatota archaeon]|nr:nucleobase:cation symporter-2 family protein [Candidatus Thermoplasmatota archaeon]
MCTRIKYGFNDVPSPSETSILAFQHALAAFGSIIAVPLIVGSAIGLSSRDISFLVNMALIASGIGTLIQTIGLGPMGAKVPCLMGTSIKFVTPAIQVGGVYGLSEIFGCTIVASLLEVVLSRFLKYIKRIFTPTVRGCVIMLIGLTFMPVGITWISGSVESLALGLLVMVFVVVLSIFGKGIISTGSVLWGMLLGYIISFPLGLVTEFDPFAGGYISIPQPLKYGFSLHVSALLPFLIVYIVSMIETIGDLLAIEEICDEEIGADGLAKGILADGGTSTIAGFFNAMPLSSFSQNIGIISLTGVASRGVVALAGVIFIISGLLPPVGNIFGAMPQPVLGGAVIIMFGLVVAAGIRVLKDAEMSRRNMLIMAVSLSLGVGVSAFPELLEPLSQEVRMVFGSGIVTGSLAAIVMELLLPEEKDVA